MGKQRFIPMKIMPDAKPITNPTPCSLYVCTVCGRGQWLIPGYPEGSLSSVKYCTYTHPNKKNARMRLATKEEVKLSDEQPISSQISCYIFYKSKG